MDLHEDEIVRFSVMYTRPSTRKHKKWEGDGFIVCCDKTESLLYTDKGKEVTRSLLTVKRINEIEDGEEFHFGSMEVQIQERVETPNRSSCTVMETSQCVIPSTSTPKFVSPSRVHSGVKRQNVDENSLAMSSAKKPFSTPITSVSPLAVKNSVRKPFMNPLNASREPQEASWIINQNDVSSGVDTPATVDGSISRHLRPHQKDGIKFIYERLKDKTGGAILADEMGLGKSVQTIASCMALIKKQHRRNDDRVCKCLLVVPSSLVNNWKGEFRKWFRMGRMPATDVKKPRDIQSYSNSFTCCPFLICSYDMALRYAPQLAAVRFDILICDEAHRLKNQSSKIRQALVSLRVPRHLLLTGTPMQNDLDEFYSLVDFARPGQFGTLPEFRQMASNEGDGTLNDLIADCMLRRTAEVNNSHLPEKHEYVLFCAPSDLQTGMMNAIGDHMTGDPLVLIDFMRKLANHPALLYKKLIDARNLEKTFTYSKLLSAFPPDYGNRAVSITDSGKLSVLVDMLACFRILMESVVIVSNYTKTLDMLSGLCSSLGLNVFRLDGQTPVIDRQKMVDRFNKEASADNVFLLSTKAGGVGLNLIGASRLILFDSDWNPAADLQAMARIWRDGQLKPCHIYRLATAGTIDEKILQRQIKKTGLGAVIDVEQISEKGSNVKFRDEDIMDIFSLSETECNTHDLLECPCDGSGILPGELEDTQDEEVEEDINDDVENYGKLDGGGEDDITVSSLTEKENTLETDKTLPDEESKTISMAELFRWRHYSARHPASWEYFRKGAGLMEDGCDFKDLTFSIHLSTKF